MVGQHFCWILLDKKMRRFKVLTWGLIADGSTDLGDFEPFVSSNLFLTAALGEVFAPLLFSVDAMVVVAE